MASRLRRAARASSCRWASASSPASSSIRPPRWMPEQTSARQDQEHSRSTRRRCISARACGRSRAVGGGVLRVRGRRCPGSRRSLDAGAQDHSHRDADRTGTRRADCVARAAEGSGRRFCAARLTACRFPELNEQRHLDRRAAAARGKGAGGIPSPAHRARSVRERRGDHDRSSRHRTGC